MYAPFPMLLAHTPYAPAASPPEVSMATAREEAGLVMCSSVEQLLKKTGAWVGAWVGACTRRRGPGAACAGANLCAMGGLGCLLR